MNKKREKFEEKTKTYLKFEKNMLLDLINSNTQKFNLINKYLGKY